MTDITSGQMVLIGGTMRGRVVSTLVTDTELKRSALVRGDPLICGDDKIPAGTTIYYISDAQDEYWYTRDQFELEAVS